MPNLAVSMRDGRFQGPCLEGDLAETIDSRTSQALDGSQHLCRNSNCSGASAVGFQLAGGTHQETEGNLSRGLDRVSKLQAPQGSRTGWVGCWADEREKGQDCLRS